MSFPVTVRSFGSGFAASVVRTRSHSGDGRGRFWAAQLGGQHDGWCPRVLLG